MLLQLLEDYGIPSRGKPSRILVNEHSTQFTNLAGSLGYFYIGGWHVCPVAHKSDGIYRF